MSALLVLLAVLAWIVAVALGLVLLVLALPFHLRARGAVEDGEPSGVAEVTWAFGLAAFEVSPGGLAFRVAGAPVWRSTFRELRRGRDERPRKGKREKRRRQEADGPERKRGARAILDHRRTLLRMLARFARALHLELRATGTIGLYDPVDTAALSTALDLLRQVPGVVLDVEIDWLDETLEGEAVGSARVWVPELLAVAVMLYLERANRAAVHALVSGT